MVHAIVVEVAEAGVEVLEGVVGAIVVEVGEGVVEALEGVVGAIVVEVGEGVVEVLEGEGEVGEVSLLETSLPAALAMHSVPDHQISKVS